MKSRRVLQIFVAVLSIIALVCLVASVGLMFVADYITVMPEAVTHYTHAYMSGFKVLASYVHAPTVAVYCVALAFPALLLLLAIILILTRKGKEAKNVVGCIFALIGAFIPALTVSVLMQTQFDMGLWSTVITWGVFAGVVALFVIFVGCALGIKPKKTVVVTEAHEELVVVSEPEAVAVEETETVEIEEPETESEEAVEAEAAEELSEEEQPEENDETVEEVEESTEEQEAVQEEEIDDGSPATQYLPHNGVTVHDIVEKTYGKESDGLTSKTIAKINKVRALYEANAITEQEYIALLNKYLG